MTTFQHTTDDNHFQVRVTHFTTNTTPFKVLQLFTLLKEY